VRKNLTIVPVFAPGKSPTATPISYITPDAADDLVKRGLALSLKGRSIRLLARARISPFRQLAERNSEAKRVGNDPSNPRDMAAADGGIDG
jgi:hypothetical protein